MHQYSLRYLLYMDHTFVLATQIQNWHDNNACQLRKSIAQCQLIGMSQYHDNGIGRFLVLRGLVGSKAALAEVSTGPWKPRKPD
jgi:hypothetical protein